MSRNLLWKIAGWFSVIFFVLFVAFVVYGLRTQCKNVAVYQYCGVNQ